MRNDTRPVLASILLITVASCVGEGDGRSGDAPGEAAAVERAEKAAQALGGELMERLLSEMQSGGPLHAVQVCSEVAQDLAAAHSVDGVTVRRVSLKVRNPADTPDDFEREALLELERLQREGALPVELTETVETAEGRRLRYMRPIVIMPACLTCHGPAESLDPDVARLIAERYPDDQATGYANGDLRGAISVTVPLN